MNLKIPVKGPDRFFIMLNLFSVFKPYRNLNRREKQVLAELYYMNHELRGLDTKKRNKLIFDYDTRKELSDKLSISQDSVYNLMSTLKKKGLLGNKQFIDKYILPYTDTITISLDEE